MTSAQIRRQFIDFFVQKHGHTFVPSSPVVPLDDPTLLFTNAGMNQFKPIFLGQETRTYKRAANTQKCIRAGGKHNDLDDVGRSRRHHTFFEMLGNWSFGDYFKQGAIEMAWELLTKVWKLDPTRLHVSCYEGNPAAGIPRDSEAAEIWKKVANLPDDHIHYFGKDNFWEMGDTGPCGPCTEIYIDRTPDKTGGPEVNGTDPRVMEIWNLVFIQYDSYFEADGAAALRAFDSAPEAERNKLPYKDRQAVIDKFRKLRELPAQHVDTGMGLERICQVLQGKNDNYAIDLFTPFFDTLTKLTGIPYTGLFPPTNAADPIAEAANPQLRHDIAFRVIADHVRCLTFALTDGAVPSNEGRGYVLRRILRRAVFWGWQHLTLKAPFLHTLVPVVVSAMSDAFPELKTNPSHIAEIIRDEEISFGRTLERGISLFEEAATRAGNLLLAQTRANQDQSLDECFNRERLRLHVQPTYWDTREFQWGGFPVERRPAISADDAFMLHDTYGFPIDLTRIMAEERGMIVDVDGFNGLMDEAKERSRNEKTGATAHTSLAELTGHHDLPHTEFIGYPEEIDEGTDVLTSCHVYKLPAESILIAGVTPFYAESGGQVGDRGFIEFVTGDRFQVEDTQRIGNAIAHRGHMIGQPIESDSVKMRMRIDTDRRRKNRANHTATHVANWALREVLGDGVQQKGSLVDPDKLRFDFSHGKPMTEEEVERVEDLVAQRITQNLRVFAMEAPQEQALKINGLRAVFGEKYPPVVRVVSIGAPVTDLLENPADPDWRNFSIEFCGGTHLRNTGEIGDFVVTAEELVSKGIRRILALTGDAARAVRARDLAVASLAKETASKPDAELAPAIATLQKAIGAGDLSLRARRRAQKYLAELQERNKKWEKAHKAQSTARLDVGDLSSRLLESAATFGPGKLVVAEIPSAPADQLLSVVDSLKKKSGSYAILLGSATDGKVNFVAAVSDDLIKIGLKAGDWIRQAAQATGGGGGGRPQLAQAGGKDPAKLPEALNVAKEFARTALST